MRLVVAAVLISLASPALAEDAAPGRFAMTPTANGFLRLDKRTGAVSLCVVKNDAVECRAAADDREALNAEIDRLAAKNAELEAGRRPYSPLNALPSREDMGRALDYAEDFMWRMMRVMREGDAPSRDRT
jgi:hypothetical protein